MTVSIKIESNVLRAVFNGELDHNSQGVKELIDKWIDREKFDRAVFDFGALTFMDSTGVGLLLGRYKKLMKKHVQLCISNPNDQIRKVLRVSGINSLIPII